MIFRQYVKKTMCGYREAEADSLEEAKAKLDDGDIINAVDDKCDCEFDDEIEIIDSEN